VIVVPGFLPYLGWAILAVLVAHEAVYSVRHLTCKPNQCECPLRHRLLAGKPLHGKTVTDATYFRKAQKVTVQEHVGPWLKLPGWKRRLYSTGPVLAIAGLLIDLTVAGAVLASLAVLLIARRAAWVRRLVRRALGWTATRLRTAWDKRAPERLRTDHLGRLWARLPLWLRSPRHRNRVQTMGMLLGTVTGAAASTAEAGIELNADYAATEPGERVGRWILPRGFKALAGEKKAAEDVWKSRIGLDMAFTWDLAADEPVMVMTRSRKMPTKVYLDDVLDKLDGLDDSKTAIGVDDQGDLGCWSWNTENPHGVINAGSRHGKTELNKCLVAQILRKGGGVTYIDPKETSIQGMEGIPGLTLLNDPGDIPAMWEGIAKFRKLMDSRRKERMADPTAVAGWNRQLLVLEEVNQFSEMSDEIWEELEEEIPGYENTMMWKPRRAKKVPPVWRHVKAIAWQAAAFKMHLMVDGQDVQATVLKGARNSLGMRLLGGYLPQQWKFLVGTTPVPPAPPIKGRWCLVNGAEQTWLQGIVGSLDPDESSQIWRDYAWGNRSFDDTRPENAATVLVGTVHGEVQRVCLSDLHKDTPRTPSGTVGLGQREAMKLSTMLERGLIPGMDADPKGRNLANLLKWRNRWADWPERRGVDGPAHLYYADEVAECVHNHRPELQQESAA
jgi:hypothetical protein